MFCSLIYGFYDIGFVGIAALNLSGVADNFLSLAIALIAVYILGFMFFLGSGGFKTLFNPTAAPLFCH